MKVQIQNQIIEFEPKWSEPYEWIAINQNGVISIFTDKPTFYGNEWIEGDEINDAMETLDQKFNGKITNAWQMVYRLEDIKVTEEPKSKHQSFHEAFEEMLQNAAAKQKPDMTPKEVYDATDSLQNDTIDNRIRELARKEFHNRIMEHATFLRLDNGFILFVSKEWLNKFTYLTFDDKHQIMRLHVQEPTRLDNGVWHADGEQLAVKLNCKPRSLMFFTDTLCRIEDLINKTKNYRIVELKGDGKTLLASVPAHLIREGYEWISLNKDGGILVHKEKPYTAMSVCWVSSGSKLINTAFPLDKETSEKWKTYIAKISDCEVIQHETVDTAKDAADTLIYFQQKLLAEKDKALEESFIREAIYWLSRKDIEIRSTVGSVTCIKDKSQNKDIIKIFNNVKVVEFHSDKGILVLRVFDDNLYSFFSTDDLKEVDKDQFVKVQDYNEVIKKFVEFLVSFGKEKGE